MFFCLATAGANETKNEVPLVLVLVENKVPDNAGTSLRHCNGHKGKALDFLSGTGSLNSVFYRQRIQNSTDASVNIFF